MYMRQMFSTHMLVQVCLFQICIFFAAESCPIAVAPPWFHQAMNQLNQRLAGMEQIGVKVCPFSRSRCLADRIACRV